jgi:hypothetical protein
MARVDFVNAGGRRLLGKGTRTVSGETALVPTLLPVFLWRLRLAVMAILLATALEMIDLRGTVPSQGDSPSLLDLLTTGSSKYFA